MARQSFKTLTEPMYYILLSLTTPRHGYGIMQHIDQITNGRVKVGAGTLYALLSRFEKEKLIESLENTDGKKPYRLTSDGLDLLKTEHHRLIQQVQDGMKEVGGNLND